MPRTKPADIEDTCALCGNHKPLTFHHLIPRKCHTNKWFKKNFEKEDMKTRGIYVCRPCHSFVHRQFDEKELGRELNTLEKLRSHETIRTYIRWARKQQ